MTAYHGPDGRRSVFLRGQALAVGFVVSNEDLGHIELPPDTSIAETAEALELFAS